MNSKQQHVAPKDLEVVENNKWLEAIGKLISVSYPHSYKSAASIYCVSAITNKVPFPECIAINEAPDWVEIEWDVKAYNYYITLKFTTDKVGNINVEFFIRPYDKDKNAQDWMSLSLLQFATINKVNLGSFIYINLTINNLLEIGKEQTIVPF